MSLRHTAVPRIKCKLKKKKNGEIRSVWWMCAFAERGEFWETERGGTAHAKQVFSERLAALLGEQISASGCEAEVGVCVLCMKCESKLFESACEWQSVRACTSVCVWVGGCIAIREAARLQSADNRLMKLYCLLCAFCEQTMITKIRCFSFPSLSLPAVVHLYTNPTISSANHWQSSKTGAAGNTHI